MLAFNVFVLCILANDLGLFYRKPREVPVGEALWTTSAYILLALCFNAWIYWQFGRERAVEFLTGYFIEYALSMDNILVFVVILTYFQVPPRSQMRVLLWGILGALVLRGVFILAGLSLIETFDWLAIVLGAFLVFTGFKTMRSGDTADFRESRVVRTVQRAIPVTPDYHGENFFVRSGSGKTLATPLLLVLAVLSVTDILFAIDSIPAVFAITRDPFIVYTSNVFAILGLRALYFALAGVIDKFLYLRFGISFALIFMCGNMIYNYLPWPDIPTEWALAVTAVLIFGSIFASLIAGRQGEKRGRATKPR